MKSYLFCCLLLLLSGATSAQIETQNPDSLDEESKLVVPAMNEQFKAGVKLGAGASMLLGNELQNPKPSYSLNGGAYLRYRFKKHLSVQPELTVSFRGALFDNDNLEYEKLYAYWVDLPVLLLYGFDEKNTKNILCGLQYSRLLNSSIFLSGSSVPEPTSPRLNKNDLLAVVGTQFQTPFVGFQLLAKYGLIDLNNGLLPNLNPPNTGKDIHQFIIELNLLF